MFGRRGAEETETKVAAPLPQAAPTNPKKSETRESADLIASVTGRSNKQAAASKQSEKTNSPTGQRSENYYDIKSTIFAALLDTIDLSQLAKLDIESAREEIRDIVNDIIGLKNIVMSISEQEDLLEDICNDVLGLGPLEPLLARDEIADIMVNGAGRTYIEVDGKMQDTSIRFRDNHPADEHLPTDREPGRAASR